MRPLSFLLALGLAPALLAQHFDPRPEGALVRLGFDGPARMAAAFQGTNLHDMLLSKEFAEAYAPVTQAIQQGIDAAKGQAPFDPQAVYDGFLRYAGRIEITFGFELVDEEPRAWGALSLGADGHTDLAAVCKEIERLALEAGAPLAERTVAGQKWLAQDLGGGFLTLPRMVGDRVVLLGGTDDAEAALGGFFPRQAPAAAKAGAPIALSFDAKSLVALIREVIEIESGDGQMFGQVMDAIGLGNVGNVDFDVARNKRFVHLSMGLATKGPRSGILAMVAPNGAKLPAVGTLVHQSPNWSVTPIDFTPLLPMLESVLGMIPDAQMDLAQIEAMAAEAMGVRLREDILAHLGGAIVIATDDAVDADAGELAGLTTMCFGLELRNGAAFGRSVETALERAGVLEMRKSEKYRDSEVHRVTVPGVGIKLYWTITDRLFLIGLGEGGRARLGGILDAAAAAGRGEAPPALAKPVRDRLEALPPNYVGLSMQKFGAVFFDAMLAGLRQGMAEDELEIDLDTVTDVLDGLRGLFGKHGLEHAVSATYLEPERIVSRMIW